MNNMNKVTVGNQIDGHRSGFRLLRRRVQGHRQDDQSGLGASDPNPNLTPKIRLQKKLNLACELTFWG